MADIIILLGIVMIVVAMFLIFGPAWALLACGLLFVGGGMLIARQEAINEDNHEPD